GRVRGDQGGVRADPGAGPGPRGQDHGAAAHPGPRREGDDTPRLRPGGAAARRHGQGAQGPRPAPGLAHLRRPLLALHAVAPELRPRRLWRRRHGALAAVGLLALVLGHAAGVLQEQQRQQWRRGGDGGRRGGAADEPGQRRRGPAVALLRRGLVADPRRAPPAGPARVPHRGRHGRRGRASAAPAVRRRRVPKPQRRRRRALPVRRRVGQRRARAPQERVGERALLRGRRRPRLEAVPLLRARVLQKRERLQVRARRPPRRPRRREDGPGRRGAAVPGLPPPLQVPAPGRGRRLRLLPHRLPPRLPLRGEQVPQLAPAAAAAAKRRAAAAAAAAALMLGGDEAHKFMNRPRLDRGDFASMMNPGSRQIYLTFPADSTFREEDVSNYFSIYGPVHDVRIPYQQKRMFGFVTFVYPETVKLILAKGNPHFICDARVLVKPYKEKGKVPDKFRKQQGERVDFSGCGSPTGLDARDPFDLHQIVRGCCSTPTAPTRCC
uniref:RRM domain-containing protein n=1 Tax=Aegilops tauschii subsp. strangulata TaxID=200361 RepID=A0A453AND0_AEGTS